VTRRPRVSAEVQAASEHERLEQRRGDVQHAREIQAAPLPLPPGRILLATLHAPTVVRVADIEEVKALPASSLGLRGRVTLVDGTQHFVSRAEDVMRAIREVRG
jgi:hypothetical protein